MKKSKTRRRGTVIEVGTATKRETEKEDGKGRGKKEIERRSMKGEEKESEGMMIGVMKNQEETKEELQLASALTRKDLADRARDPAKRIRMMKRKVIMRRGG